MRLRDRVYDGNRTVFNIFGRLGVVGAKKPRLLNSDGKNRPDIGHGNEFGVQDGPETASVKR